MMQGSAECATIQFRLLARLRMMRPDTFRARVLQNSSRAMRKYQRLMAQGGGDSHQGPHGHIVQIVMMAAPNRSP